MAKRDFDQLEQYKIGFVEFYIKQFVKENDRILDVGCGRGQYRHSTSAFYVGIDITADDYKEGQRRIVDTLGSARFLPFKENVFDLIFTVGSFHLFPGPVLCLKDIYRCLKPGGKFVCFDYTRKTLERFVSPYYETNISCHSVWTGRQLGRFFRVVGFCDVRWWVPDIKTGYKAKMAHFLSPIYRYVHDFREGWWVVEGKK